MDKRQHGVSPVIPRGLDPLPSLLDPRGMSSGERRADLVFEGGGVKGIGLAGAYSVISERGFAPHGVAGTSAGAIMAALVAAGYSAEQLAALVREMPYATFKDRGWEDRLPLIGRELSVVLDHGVYEGAAFHDWIAARLAAKGITRFGQLVDPAAEDPAQRYRLRVIASDVTHRRMLVLPNDAHHLGMEPDELEIAYAVRMSMSIPFFFEPVVHTNPRTGEEHLIVDGGMLSNFPVWLFDCEGREPRWPTFGLMLAERDPHAPLGESRSGPRATSLVDYVKAIAMTMMEAHDRLYLEEADFARTIPIPTMGVGTTEFDITPERADRLFQSGRDAAAGFLDRWDFDAYVREYRSGHAVHRRRDAVGARLRAAA
jgi:NTE family protein